MTTIEIRAGVQFLHLEVYARKPPRKAQSRRLSLRQLIAEAAWEEGAHPHVVTPRSPRVVWGLLLPEVERKAVAQAAEARDRLGRRLRRDAPVIAAGVASFHVSVVEVEAATPAGAAYEAWVCDTVKHLRRVHGDALVSVMEHRDEWYPHLHYYCLPDLLDERLDWERAHPGRHAQELAVALPRPRRPRLAYTAAMRGYQDAYYEAVGIHHGQTRLGPRRRRLSREQWRAEKAAAQHSAIRLALTKAAESDVARLYDAVHADAAAAAFAEVAAERAGFLAGVAAAMAGEVLEYEEVDGRSEVVWAPDLPCSQRAALGVTIQPALSVLVQWWRLVRLRLASLLRREREVARREQEVAKREQELAALGPVLDVARQLVAAKADHVGPVFMT